MKLTRYLTLILALGALRPVFPVCCEQSATLWAGLGEGFSVYGKRAIRIITAAVEGALLLAHLLHQLFATLRAVDAGLDLKRLGVFTIGKTTAGEEFSEASVLNY